MQEKGIDEVNTGFRQQKEKQYVHGSDRLRQLVLFNIGSQEFGVDIMNVQEISRMVEITKVPGAPRYVEGVKKLRDRAIPIVDLRKRLNLEPKEYNNNSRIVVVDIGGDIVGMAVDSVSGVLRLAPDSVETPPEGSTGIDAEYIKGVAKVEDRLLILLELSKVVDMDEMLKISG